MGRLNNLGSCGILLNEGGFGWGDPRHHLNPLRPPRDLRWLALSLIRNSMIYLTYMAMNGLS